MTTFSAASADCRKFAPNIFNRVKCQNCFRTKDAHSAEALESNRATRKASKCGYLFVAPDWDFSLSINRTKRWQRRWFVLYDDGELTYSVDEHPDTVPQAVIDMNKVVEVSDAEHITGNPFSLAVSTPEKTHYIKGTSREESRWWFDVLSGFPKNTIRNKHKRNATYPGVKSSNGSEKFSPRGEMESRPSSLSADQRRVEVENAHNKLHSTLPSPPQTIITIKDRENFNDDIPIIEKGHNVMETPTELLKGFNRRYLKKENKTGKNQRSRSDGVSKMVPNLSVKEYFLEHNQRNCHQNPVFLMLSEGPNQENFADKGETVKRSSKFQDSSLEKQEIQMRGDPDGCGLDYTNHPCPKNECGTGPVTEPLLRQGWLSRHSPIQEWHKHWFLLQGLSLKYFRDPTSQILDGVLDMGQVQRIEEVDLDNRAAFCLEMSDSKKHILAAATTSLRTNWVLSILTASGLLNHISSAHHKNKEVILDTVSQPLLHSSISTVHRANHGNIPPVNNSEISQDKSKSIEECPKIIEEREDVISFKSFEKQQRGPEELSTGDKEQDLLPNERCASSPSNEERVDSDSLKDDSYYTLPPSPLLNRTAISRVKEKARSRSSSRSRSSHKLQRTPDSSFFTADSDLPSEDEFSASFYHNNKLESPLPSVDIVDGIKVSSSPCFEELYSCKSIPKVSCRGKEDKLYKTFDSGSYKDLEEQYLNLKRKYEIAEKKRLENSECKALRSKYESLKLKYKREKVDNENKTSKDNDSEKGKRDSDRKSKKDIEISRLKATIIDLQERCAKLQENIAHHKLEIAFLTNNLNLKIRENDILERELLVSQEALNRIFADENKNGDGQKEKSYQLVFKKFRNAILNVQNELREAYKNCDDLEIFSSKLKHQIFELKDNHNCELKFLNARIDDLTQKLSLSEKNARQVKQKLTKLEAKQERRRSSLKSKESMSLSKEYEAKLSELEQKLASIEIVLNPLDEKTEANATSLSSNDPELNGISSTALKIESPQSKSGESSNMLMRLYDLDTKVKEVSQKAKEEESPKVILKNFDDGKIQNEEKYPLSLTINMPDLRAIEGYEETFSTLSECCEYLERKVESVLEWLKLGFQSLNNYEAHKEIELMQKLIERSPKKADLENKNDLEVLLYKILLIREIVRALNHYSKVSSIEKIEGMFADTVKKLDSILSLISNEEFCIWTRPDIKEELKKVFFEDFPALAQHLGIKFNKQQYNQYEKQIVELKTKLKETNETWFPHSSSNSSMIDIEEILECIKSNMKNIFFKNIEQQVLAIHFSTVQILKAHFQEHYSEELSFLSGKSTKEPMEMVLKICTLAYLIASICFLQSLLELFGEDIPAVKEEEEKVALLSLPDCQTPGVEQDFFALKQCPKTSEILSTSTTNLDLSQIAYAYQIRVLSCSICPHLKKALDQALNEHRQEVETLQDRIDQLVCLLEKKEEEHKEQMRILDEKLEESRKEQDKLQEEYNAHIESLQEMYSQKLNQSTELKMAESIRNRYKHEIEQLKNLCDKGLTAMESSHRHFIQELKKAHQKEVVDLQAERDKLLAEETQATVTALAALKRSHQQELDKLYEELARHKSFAEPQPQFYMAELSEVKREIVDLLDNYSAKCLEKISLEERLEASLQQLQEANLQVLDLAARNKQLWAQLSSNFCQKVGGLPQNDSSLKNMLAMKQQEVVQQQDEISHLRQQLNLAQTRADTLTIHCQELEEALQSLREEELCNFTKRLESLIQAASGSPETSEPLAPDDPPNKEPGPSIDGALLKTSSGPPILVKSYSCSHEVQQRPSYPGVGTYTGSSAWRASPS